MPSPTLPSAPRPLWRRGLDRLAGALRHPLAGPVAAALLDRLP